jgi:hypothetical protein
LASISQQDEETRIATLAHALNKLGNPEDAAEFMRCLNAICEEGDGAHAQSVGSRSDQTANRYSKVILSSETVHPYTWRLIREISLVAVIRSSYYF